MKRLFCSLSAVLGLLMSSFAAQAAVPIPVGAIPQDAAVVIRLADPDASIGKIQKMVEAIDPQYSQNVQALSFFSGTLLDNPAKAGVKKGTDWWMAGFVRKNEEPVVLIAVQPTDVAAIKDAVGEDYQYIEHDNWLLYTKDAKLAAAVKACVAGTGKNVEIEADKNAQQLIMQSDAAVWINVSHLAETFAEEIEGGVSEAQRALEEAGNSAPAIEGINLNAALGMYSDLFDALVVGLKDTKSCTVGVTVGAAGIGIHEYVDLEDDSKTDLALRKHLPASFESFGKLPANQLAYLGMHGDMQSISEWGINFMMEMFEPTEEDAKSMKEALEETKKLEFGEYVASFRIGTFDTGLMNMSVLSQVKNAAKVRDVYEKMFKGMSSLGSSPLLTQSIEFEKEAETIEGYPVDKMTVIQEFDESLDPTGLQKQMMQIMYGPEGAVSRVAYTDQFVAQTTGGGKEQMELLLKGLKTPSSDAAYEGARGQLLPKANILVMFDLAGTVGAALQAAIESGKFPIPVTEDQIESLGLKPSFLGFSVSTGKGSFEAKHFVEAEQIRGLYQIGVLGFGIYQSLSAPEF
ncbi:MAG TPA: hypothetical protein VMM56_05760 [Planctomycetaceae bacterium]|nr:hypothetical protein [Planctomycetaceae bacterium]